MPQSFLTALVQIASRKNNWSLDRSTFFTVVTDFADPDDVEERLESVSRSKQESFLKYDFSRLKRLTY